MIKAPTPTEKSKKQRDNTKETTYQKLRYTTIADRLSTVSWCNNSNHASICRLSHIN